MPTNTLAVDELVKPAGEDRDYLFDFSDVPELAAGSGITLVSGAVAGGDGLTFGLVTVTPTVIDGIPVGKALVCRISGGTDDVTYEFSMTATLSHGRKLVLPCRLAVAADYE